MRENPVDDLKHSHRFDEGNPAAERNTLRVAVLTATMMVIEIAGGWYYNSMALMADGWHMSSHALAMMLSLLAYVGARKYAHDPRFSFGTWKIEILGGYTSAVFLVVMAVLMVYQSIERLISPTPIYYDQAILIAIAGLLVNLTSAWLLREHHHHAEEHDGHVHGHHDLNLRSAYLHVLADAATSVLAIVALICGRFWGWDWMDPLMGLFGAALILFWAFGLLRDSGSILLDAEMDKPVVDEIREVIANSPVRAEIADLHVWRVARGKYACILSLATDNEVSPEYFKKRLSVHDELVHISIEINRIRN